MPSAQGAPVSRAHAGPRRGRPQAGSAVHADRAAGRMEVKGSPFLPRGSRGATVLPSSAPWLPRLSPHPRPRGRPPAGLVSVLGERAGAHGKQRHCHPDLLARPPPDQSSRYRSNCPRRRAFPGAVSAVWPVRTGLCAWRGRGGARALAVGMLARVTPTGLGTAFTRRRVPRPTCGGT